jgi:hypothetical protein
MANRYIPNLDTIVIYRLDRFARGGHHRPFNDLGYPAVCIMETNEHYDRQHQDLCIEDGKVFGDTIEGGFCLHREIDCLKCRFPGEYGVGS